MISKTLQLFFLFILLLPAVVFSQTDEYLIKTGFIEQFTRFIDWPDSSGINNPANPFIIGVLGDNPFGDHLNQLARLKKVKRKKVEIKKCTNIEDSFECQILFISRSEKNKIKNILAQLYGRPILTISEIKDFARLGGMINFYISNEYIRFEINADCAAGHGFYLSSRLLKLAKIVGSE